MVHSAGDFEDLQITEAPKRSVVQIMKYHILN